MTNIKSSIKEILPPQVISFYRKGRGTLEPLLPDALFYQIRSLEKHGYFCNFKRPRRFNEKILHRMRYPLPIFSILADKVRVRDYIAKTVGAQHLVPCYLVCDRVTPEILETLPSSFVMKANHSSGQFRIISDKTQEDFESLSQTANAWLEINYSKYSREKHYAGITPKIIFEKALLLDGKPPTDYKFNVLNSKPNGASYIFVEVFGGRLEKPTENFFLEDWSAIPFTLTPSEEPSNDPELLAPPANLKTMLDLAKKLASPFGYLRVDLYSYKGQIYVGELTITPAGGNYKITPPEWDLILGNKFGWPEDPSSSQSI